MKSIALVILTVAFISLVGCGGGGGSAPVVNPQPQTGAAQVSVSLHDMPPAGVTVLSFQATITGIAMQPGSISLLNSPMTLEMTQLQTMSAYIGTISVPAGNYTGMTITLANPHMTFLNNTGGMMGGMMGGGNCANGQICQLNPTMTATSVTINGVPFPITVMANSPLDMMMDFDLMDSLQSNMGMSPMMTSGIQQGIGGANMFDEMDDMIGQIASVNAGGNQFTMSFVQGMPSMTIGVDSNTTFQNFSNNSMAGLAQGQLVLVEIQLMAGGTLHAAKVRFESDVAHLMDGMIVAVNNQTQFDMVVMNEAPSFQGVNVGDVIRMNMQAGTTFDVDDMDMPVSGMNFAAAAMMIGQMVQIEPTSTLVSGTPPQLSTNHVRLMKAFVTATVASKIDATTFTLSNLPGIFGAVGISNMKINTFAGTAFENVSNMGVLNVGDTVSVRGPTFMSSGEPTMIASKVVKR